MKILVVEDELKTGNYLRQVLTEAGFVVDLARNGVDGLHQARTESYDLVFLDIMLPGGGGAIGLEIALALKHLGIEVVATKRSPQILGDELDPDMSEIISQFIAREGIQNYFGKQIERINGLDKVESVVIAGETIPCEMVVMATGIEPISNLAVEAGLNVEKGFIVSDNQMRSSDSDIYAVGDTALSFSIIDGKPLNVALATTAYRQAVIAGVNAAGGDMKYEGNIGTFVTYFGGLEVSCTGYNTLTAEA